MDPQFRLQLETAFEAFESGMHSSHIFGHLADVSQLGCR